MIPTIWGGALQNGYIAAPSFVTAQYWRILRVAGGDASFVGLIELNFSGVAGSTTGGTAIGSTQYSATYSYAKAFDGGTGRWVTQAGQQTNSWVGYNFGTPFECSSIRIQGENVGSRTPYIFDVQYSSNGSSWTTYERITTTSFANYQVKTFNLTAGL